MHLVIGNAGPTVARNVRVVFSPDPPVSDKERETINRVLKILQAGLHSLAPNRTVSWPVGRGHELMNPPDSKLCVATVNADGPNGPIPVIEIPIDIAEWREARDAPAGSLHHVRQAIQELTRGVAATRALLHHHSPIGDNDATPKEASGGLVRVPHQPRRRGTGLRSPARAPKWRRYP